MGDCEKFPLYKTEPVPENLVGIVNLTEWSYCDVDAVGPAAADRIANQNTHIAALQQEIEKLRGQVPRWIPVEERLPENGVPVLINYIASDDGKYHPDGTAVWTDYGCFWWEGSLEDCDTEVAVPITHWMPLPEPPKEK